MDVDVAPPAPMISRVFDGAVLGLGMILFLGAVGISLTSEWTSSWYYLLCIPVVVLLSRFPLLLDRGDAGIEVGFDSSVLMFLICTLPPHEAMVIWSLGALTSQLISSKRPASKRFNIGVGISGGAVAIMMITALRGDVLGTPRELLAVTVGATAYFVADLLISGVSVALEEQASIRRQLIQPGSAIAVACFVPFDSLGYLGAVVVRSAPLWTVALLAVPLITLLVATQAVTRGRENSRRLSVLFDASVRIQALTTAHEVRDALIANAGTLLRLPDVEIRLTAPQGAEIGALLRDPEQDHWIVAPARNRARSTIAADRQALEAMAAVASDAFVRLRLTDEMARLARHDVLTGLPNRALLLDRVEHALAASKRHGRRLALLFCDLDGFKQVNDRFGHGAGDEVLIDVAQRLSSCIRNSDTVARLGGDEFAILLEDIDPTQVNIVSERILDALRSGTMVAEHRLPLSTSIGVALQDEGHTAAQMLLDADMAMYEAKNLGKNRCVVYEQTLGHSRVERLELVESLRAAITAQELHVVYQPIVQLDTGNIVGVEALCRWAPHGIPVRPDVFIPLAEESGLINRLGDQVLDIVTADASELLAAAGNQLSIAVNISPQQLCAPAFASRIEEMLGQLAGGKLVLEITERDLVTDDPVGIETMIRLADQDVRFALDDFGVGYSSIGYLQTMPIRIIKADGSFSSEIDQDERSCGLLGSIMAIGQALNIDVVVEGLERSTQVDHVRDHVGGNLGQGYLLHRPMPLQAVVAVLRENRQQPSIAELTERCAEPIEMTTPA